MISAGVILLCGYVVENALHVLKSAIVKQLDTDKCCFVCFDS